jgi:HD-like signal output (HDOD) protein
MIGIGPFFRAFSELPIIEDRLRDYPQALLGLLKAIGRARRAAHWAREWAIQRRDMDVDEITLATLLHDVAELMMWIYAPKLALKFRDAQRAAPNRRSALIQEEVFGLPLYKLKLALAETWHLPALVAQLLDDRQAENPRVRNVKLAVDLARHAANGWTDPALPDDFKAIRDLLHVNQEALLRHLDVSEEDAQLILAMDPPGA